MDHHTEEEDSLSCSICIELMTEPKVLPCLHRFCESCLDNYITTSATRAADVTLGFSCPVCRQLIPAPDTSSPPSTWAAGFKTDFLVKRLIELYISKQEHDNKEPQISHPCPEHADTEVDLYCFDCSATVCHICAATNHHNCNRLSTVNKATDEYRSLLLEKINRIQSEIDKSSKRELVQECYMREVHKKVMLGGKEIRESAHQMQELVNAQKDQLLDDLHKHYKVLQQNVSAAVLILRERANKLQDLVKMTTLKITSCPNADFFLLTSLNAVIESYDKQYVTLSQQHDSLCKRISDVKYRFKANRSPCVSLGDILFVSNRNNVHSSGDPTQSGSRSSGFNPGPESSPSGSQSSGFNPGPASSPSGSQSSEFNPGPASSPSGSQSSGFTPGPSSSSSGSHTHMSTRKPTEPLADSQSRIHKRGNMSRNETERNGESSDVCRVRSFDKGSDNDTYLPPNKKKKKKLLKK